MKYILSLLAIGCLSACSRSSDSPVSSATPFAYHHPSQKSLSLAERAQKGLSFVVLGRRFVSLDFQNVQASIRFDPSKRESRVVATVNSIAEDSGYPYFYFDPQVALSEISNDGKSWIPMPYESISDLSGLEKLKTFNTQLVAGAHFFIRLTYNLPNVDFSVNGGVNFQFSMGDIGDVSYLEKWLPANVLSDPFPLQLKISLLNVNRSHILFSNATAMAGNIGSHMNGNQMWDLHFPNWYNSSAHFLVLSTNEVLQRQSAYISTRPDGTQKTIPIYLYTYLKRMDVLLEAEQISLKTLSELEQKLGPYAHDSLVVQVENSGGMEYAGATMSSTGALAHEIFHFWYGRGVLAGDDGGWFDEGINVWYAAGAPQVSEIEERDLVQLAGLSPLYRSTSPNAYGYGAQFFAEVNYLLDGKLIEILSLAYKNFYRLPLNTQELLNFIGQYISLNRRDDYIDLINEFVYGLRCEWMQQAAIARTDRRTTYGSRTITIPVLNNDRICTAPTLELASVDLVSAHGGTVRSDATLPSGSYRYKPADGFRGLDSFSYRLKSGEKGRVLVWVRNEPPMMVGRQRTESLVPGLLASYFTLGKWELLPDFSQLIAFKIESLLDFHFNTSDEILGSGEIDLGLQLNGYIQIPAEDLYFFYVSSDDGSKLRINDQEIVLNDGNHVLTTRRGMAFLGEGLHKYSVDYMDTGGEGALSVEFSAFESSVREPVNGSNTYHAPQL